MKIFKNKILISFFLIVTLICSISIVQASSSEVADSRLSLWKDGKTLIKNNSTMELEVGSKIWVGYNPKENFSCVKYQFVALPTVLENGMTVMPKVYFEPVEEKVFIEENGNYNNIAIVLPKNQMRVKLQMLATLVDGSKTEMKEYEFNLVKKNLWTDISIWAESEVNDANLNGLIPETLLNKDFTQGITRKEFAAIAVKLYEVVSGKEFKETLDNPFIDTKDKDVIKAYSLNITNGVSATEFAPDKIITREQMATMMTRTLYKLGIKSEVEIKNRFADHNNISDWAKDSVYFMTEKEIIKGVGENMFKGKNTATREQAVVVAQRCLKNLCSHN